MKRICFISLTAYGYFNEKVEADGGAERQFNLISKNLANKFDVRFVVGDYGQPKVESRDGVTLHRAYKPVKSTSEKNRIKQVWQLYKVLWQVDADVYITRCSPRKMAIIFPFLRSIQKPLVYHIAVDSRIRKSRYETGARKRIYRQSLPRVAEVVAQTPDQAKTLQDDWNIESTIIPNGYPPADMIDLFESRKHFLWVGRLTRKQKQPHLFLDLAEQFPNEEFVLIGDGADNEYTRTIVERAVEAPNVTYTGWVPPSEIHTYYKEAIALINTSVSEGFPNVFLEAWRYATPVVALHINPGRFLETESGSLGYVDGEFETLEEIIGQLATSINKREELGKIGLQTFTEKYSLSSVVTSYQELLEQI